MSVWTTKSFDRNREYIVLRHTLRGVNYIINGIKFRDGFAVVAKNSKDYYNLKKIPVLKGAQEFPLIHLRKLPFITRTLDIKTIYGRDVYRYYLQELDKELKVEKVERIKQEIVEHIQENKLCSRKIIKDGEEYLCSLEAEEVSPSGYCKRHILLDPKLPELGIQVPLVIPKHERKKFADKVLNKLKDLKNETQE